MNIIMAMDSFKGSNSSLCAGERVQEGIMKVFPDAVISIIPISDGGEGFVEAAVKASAGIKKSTIVNDPLMRPVTAFYGISKDLAFIEMAAASGLTLIPEELRDPGKTTTFGTGEIIKEIITQGFRKILIGIGGSATNDGGAGMAQALGYKLLDKGGKEIPPGGENLHSLSTIRQDNVLPLLKNTKIIIASDVRNPLLGKNGAVMTYARQKGAAEEQLPFLEENLKHLKNIVSRDLSPDFSETPGAGAAGGLGFGLLSFCGAEIRSGINTILDLASFDSLLDSADIIVTGEGRIDGQSLQGKVPVGIAERALRKKVPVLALVGDIDGSMEMIYKAGIASVMSTVNKAMALKEAMALSSPLLTDAAERAFRMIKLGMSLR